MLRTDSPRLVLGSVSALAVTTMLAACSQPASYATVDLSGSNGSFTETAQAYSPVTGQPVYQSTSLFGPQSFPDAAQYQPTSQFAAVDVPQNQVASLGFDGGGFDTFGILDQQQSIPQYTPVASSPVFQQPELLASPQFQSEIQSVDRAFLDTGPLNAPAPFAEAESLLDVAPFEPLENIEPVTVEPVEVETGPSAQVAYAEPQRAIPSLPSAPRRNTIEESALEPLAPAAPRVNRDVDTVADDYATLPGAQTRSTPPADVAPRSGYRSRYDAWDAPRYDAVPSAPQAQTRAPAAPQVTVPRVTAAPAPAPTRDPVRPAGPDSDYTRAALDLLGQRPQQVRLPAPTAVPAPQAVPQVQFGGGLTVPKASAEYPRPYELLRPGVWPELQNPGQGLVQAPAPTPVPQFASLPVPPSPQLQIVDRASEREVSTYEIKRGDTFLTIAQRVGTTPETLAFENGFTPDAKIYIGQKLILPTAKTKNRFANETVANVEVVPADQVSDIGGDTVPVISAEAGDFVTERMPIQRASIPTRRATTSGDPAKFAWPVHGEVYRLDAGQVEIEAAGNTPVSASAAGKVVHVERGAMGVLVVIEHDNGWRSLTVGLDYSAVRPDTRVAQGDMIGKSSRDHRVRFELRDADASVADVLNQLRG